MTQPPPPTPTPNPTPVQAWSQVHAQDVSHSRLATAWITLVHRLAPHLDQVPPDLLSAAGVLTTAAALPAAAAGHHWPLLALLLLTAAGLLDGLDGAVAIRTGKVRPLGAVVDAVADRLSDLCLLAVLVLLGAPERLATAVGAALLLHEYARARAQGVGLTGAAAVTIAERPTRVVVVAVACLGAGIWPDGAPWFGWSWGALCLWLWAAISAIGGAHLAVALTRALRQ